MTDVGGGATEAATPLSAEDQAKVGRRVAIGAVATLGLAAFALIPTKDLRVVKPTKPMFFYITQLLQAQVGQVAGGALHFEVGRMGCQLLYRAGARWSAFSSSTGRSTVNALNTGRTAHIICLFIPQVTPVTHVFVMFVLCCCCRPSWTSVLR